MSTVPAAVPTPPDTPTKPLKLLTPRQLAEKLGVPVSWVREKTRERCPDEERIPCVRLPGGRYVGFIEQHIDEWLLSHELRYFPKVKKKS